MYMIVLHDRKSTVYLTTDNRWTTNRNDKMICKFNSCIEAIKNSKLFQNENQKPAIEFVK